MNFINSKILDLIYSSIKSEGGDGDAIWLTKYTSLDKIKELIDEYDAANNTGWHLIRENNTTLYWGDDQEWATITDDENVFNSQPSWIILRINY